MEKTERKRRTRRPLTRERIIEAAVKIIDRDGLDALSMRQLGATLGVEAMSLYNYFPTKQALLKAISATLVVSVVTPSEDVPWQQWLREAAAAHRALFVKHINALPIFTPHLSSEPAFYNDAEKLLRVLTKNGIPAHIALSTLRALNAAVIGFAIAEAAALDDTTRPDFAGREAFVRDILEDHPLLRSIIEGVEYAAADEAFAFGIDLIVRGLEAYLAEKQ